MKQRVICFVVGILALAAASVASARVNVSIGIGIDPYGPPPVVYRPDPYYVAPPVVYIGDGHWGDWHHWKGHRRHR